MTPKRARTALGSPRVCSSRGVRRLLRTLRRAGQRAARHRMEPGCRGPDPGRGRRARGGPGRPGDAARTLAAAAPQRPARADLRRARRRRRSVLLLRRRRPDAGRPGVDDRVHRAGRGGALALAAPRPASRAGDDSRRRTGRSRPGAGARPGLRARARPDRRAVGAGRHGGAHRLLRDLGRREQRPPTDDAGGRRARGRHHDPRRARPARAVADADRRRRRVVRRPHGRLVGAAARAGPRERGSCVLDRHRRRTALGSRLASFVALLEVVAAIGFAWLLLGELPHLLQLVGGLLVLAGVVVVKLRRATRRASEPSAAVSDPSTPGLASPRRP